METIVTLITLELPKFSQRERERERKEKKWKGRRREKILNYNKSPWAATHN